MMEKYDSAKKLADAMKGNLDALKTELLMEHCETSEDARYVSNSCSILANFAISAHENLEIPGLDSEQSQFMYSLFITMIAAGGATIQLWLAEKAAEYEELKDEQS